MRKQQKSVYLGLFFIIFCFGGGASKPVVSEVLIDSTQHLVEESSTINLASELEENSILPGYLAPPEVISAELKNLVLDNKNYAYVQHGDKIVAVDISNKNNPKIVDDIKLPGFPIISKIFLTHDHLYFMIDGELFAISVHDPNNMQLYKASMPSLNGRIEEIFINDSVLIIFTEENELYSMISLSSLSFSIADVISDVTWDPRYFELEHAIFKDGILHVAERESTFAIKIGGDGQFLSREYPISAGHGYLMGFLELGGLTTVFKTDPGDLGNYYSITSWSPNNLSQAIVSMYSPNVPSINGVGLDVVHENYVISNIAIQYFVLADDGSGSMIWRNEYTDNHGFDFKEVEHQGDLIVAIFKDELIVASLAETGDLTLEGQLDFMGQIYFCEERLQPLDNNVYGIEVNGVTAYKFDPNSIVSGMVEELPIGEVFGELKTCIFDNVNNKLYMILIQELEDDLAELEVIAMELETLKINSIRFQVAWSDYRSYIRLAVNDSHIYLLLSDGFSSDVIYTLDILLNGSLAKVGTYQYPLADRLESGNSDNILVVGGPYADNVAILDMSDPNSPQELSNLSTETLDMQEILWVKRLSGNMLIAGVNSCDLNPIQLCMTFAFVDVADAADPQILFKSENHTIKFDNGFSILFDLTTKGFVLAEGGDWGQFVEYEVQENVIQNIRVTPLHTTLHLEDDRLSSFAVLDRTLLVNSNSSDVYDLNHPPYDSNYPSNVTYKSHFLDNFVFMPIVGN